MPYFFSKYFSYKMGSSFIPSTVQRRCFDASRPMCCAICGRKAHYYHFNVAACEGCGFFFKRCIYKNKNYVCSRSGNCPNDRVLECRACRFDKCILAGMKLEMMKFPRDFDLDEAIQRVAARKEFILDSAMQELGEKHFEGKMIKIEPIVDDADYEQILNGLVNVEWRHRRIRESSTNVPDHFYRSKCIADLCHSKENIIALAERFSQERTHKIWPEMENKKMGKKIASRPPFLHLDLFFSIEMAKTMPAFAQLDLDDKIALLSHVSMVSMVLSAGFYSLEQQETTIVFPDGMRPILITHFDKGYCSSNVIPRIRVTLFADSLKAFRRIGLSQEEMILLRAIIFSHITTPNLSPTGQSLLLGEAEKYAKILLRHCQRRLGDAEGAKRYAECVLFIEFLFRNAQQHREFLTILESHSHKTVPPHPFPSLPQMPAFVKECVKGCVELPKIEEMDF